jgi:hypothetical protein
VFTYENVKHGMGGDVALDGVLLNMDAVAEKLNEVYRGFSQDPIGRRFDMWAPRVDELQGLFHMHKHICSMDRGLSPQWPRFTTKTGLKTVPLHYALLHEDLPVVCLPEDFKETPREELMDMNAPAMVEATQIDDVKMIGWAEVLHQITVSCPWISLGDLGRLFGVATEWAGQINGSPLTALWNEAERHAVVAR